MCSSVFFFVHRYLKPSSMRYNVFNGWFKQLDFLIFMFYIENFSNREKKL